jgi:multiple sugar transport system permease protein
MRRWQTRDARAASVATLRGTGPQARIVPRWRRRAVRALKRTALYLAALAFTVFAVFPFYWMFLTAFKTNRDLYVGATNLQHIPWIFNEPPTLQHVRLLFLETQYLVWVRNTVLVGALVVLVTLLVAVPAGYALARLAGRWGERLGIAIFLTYLIPPTLLFIPFARVIAMLHLQNTLWALVLIYPTFTIPFCTWLLMGFFRSIPRDIEEQGMIDGYSRLAVIRRVMFPLAVSGILTAAMFAFTLVMQEFVYALTFISAVGRMTVSLGVPVALVRGDVFYWGSLMAAALITSIPIAVVYNLFIDRFIQGLTAGAVKG